MNFLINHIYQILDRYDGTYPLANELKIYFKEHPKLGSRDRKAISEAIFLYFRYARLLPDEYNPIAVIQHALVESNSQNPFLDKFINQKRDILFPKRTSSIFPEIQFSENITRDNWLASIKQKPLLFIRVVKSYESIVAILKKNDIPYTVHTVEAPIPLTLLGLPNSTPLNNLLQPEWYVVQDLSSQKTLQHFWNRPEVKEANTIWDVCAGAGGKSLVLRQLFPKKELIATDIRASILQNLEARFKLYQFKKPQTAVVDASNGTQVNISLGHKSFDAIVCDVPCSGSGTWSRTPEQFYFFKKDNLEKFRQLQYPIAKNAASKLKSGGIFAYITCSVFQEENEEVCKKLEIEDNLHLLESQLVNGINSQADCLFFALFQKK